MSQLFLCTSNAPDIATISSGPESVGIARVLFMTEHAIRSYKTKDYINAILLSSNLIYRKRALVFSSLHGALLMLYSRNSI